MSEWNCLSFSFSYGSWVYFSVCFCFCYREFELKYMYTQRNDLKSSECETLNVLRLFILKILPNIHIRTLYLLSLFSTTLFFICFSYIFCACFYLHNLGKTIFISFIWAHQALMENKQNKTKCVKKENINHTRLSLRAFILFFFFLFAWN